MNQPADPKQFMDLIEQKKFDEARPLIPRLSNINLRNIDKGLNTPLHFVVRWGTPELVEKMLAAGADVNAKNAYGERPLTWAAAGGNLDNVKLIMKVSPDFTGNVKGWTPLHAAAKAGQKEVLTYLLENGADLNAKTNDGETVLDVAENCGQTEVVKYLKEKWLGSEWTNPTSDSATIDDWKKELGTIRSALAIYYGDTEGKYPQTLEELVPRYLVKVPGPEFEYTSAKGEVIYKPYPEY